MEGKDKPPILGVACDKDCPLGLLPTNSRHVELNICMLSPLSFLLTSSIAFSFFLSFCFLCSLPAF